jgi:cell division protein FtsA
VKEVPKRDMRVAVDVGTSKISCLIGEYREDLGMEILGRGTAPSHGIKKGAITDVDECAKSIELAVIEAENSAGVRVNSVTAGVSGEYIITGNGRGKVRVGGRNYEISRQDVNRVIATARNGQQEGTRILHVVPRIYSIDGHEGVKNPEGMIGRALEVDAYVIAGKENHLQNIYQAFTRSGLELNSDNYVFSSLGAARAVVTESEKNLGVVLIDIGAGTTKITVYKHGALVHSRVLPLGGDLITYDIAMFYKIPLSEAESLKITDGSACPDLLTSEEEEEEVEAVSFSESQSIVMVQKQMLAKIIEARLMDIFEAIRKDLHKLSTKGIYVAGVIFTGGTAKTKHIQYLAQRILNLPAKIGKPANVPGLGEWEGNPEFASVVGTLHLAGENSMKELAGVSSGKSKAGIAFRKLYQWLQDVF